MSRSCLFGHKWYLQWTRLRKGDDLICIYRCERCGKTKEVPYSDVENLDKKNAEDYKK